MAVKFSLEFFERGNEINFLRTIEDFIISNLLKYISYFSLFRYFYKFRLDVQKYLQLKQELLISECL